MVISFASLVHCMMPVNSPLIITLSLDKASHDYFTQLRHRYFPRYCNWLEAHLTLFHSLPAAAPGITEKLQELMKQSAIDLQVTGVVNTGKGVAFTIVSEELLKLHKEMQGFFAPWLRSKDRAELWPHITVQNSVTAYKARLTKEELIKNFEPFSIQGIGFASWLYLKGPWQPVHTYLFTKG
jgi:hypothetical protein